MFGLSFGEVTLLVIVAIVVIGPRQLPSMMRTAGQWVSRIRRMSTDLRTQSGIDQLMRDEGIERSIQEIRSLSNINVLDGLERMAQPPVVPPSRSPRTTSGTGAIATLASTASDKPAATNEEKPGSVSREREYPLVGCDSYGALPDDAAPYGAVATSNPMTFGVQTKPSSGGAAQT